MGSTNLTAERPIKIPEFNVDQGENGLKLSEQLSAQNIRNAQPSRHWKLRANRQQKTSRHTVYVVTEMLRFIIQI